MKKSYKGILIEFLCNKNIREDQKEIKPQSPVGKHNDIPDSEFDPEELKKGIEVEKEHTDSEEIAKAITKDHLSELKDYYTRLLKMEKES